jgi:hypothetical protein
MFTNPEPEVAVIESDGEGPMPETYSRGPQFAAKPLANPFELKGSVSGVVPEQGELLVRTQLNLDRQRTIVVPEIRVCPVRQPRDALKRSRFPGLVIRQGALDAVVEASGIHVRLQLCVDGLVSVIVQPSVELVKLFGLQCCDRALDVAYVG